MLDILAKDAEKENQVIALVENLLHKHAQKEETLSEKNKSFRVIINNLFTDNSEEEKLAIYLVSFFSKRGRAEEAAAVIQRYKYISEFRELLLQQALQQQRYDVARQLIQDAKEQEKALKFSGYSSYWDEWLLQIAEAEQNTPETQRLARILF